MDLVKNMHNYLSTKKCYSESSKVSKTKQIFMHMTLKSKLGRIHITGDKTAVIVSAMKMSQHKGTVHPTMVPSDSLIRIRALSLWSCLK